MNNALLIVILALVLFTGICTIALFRGNSIIAKFTAGIFGFSLETHHEPTKAVKSPRPPTSA